MISVITPCKNIISDGREEFFRKMIDTLYSQTYQDFEHIIVDGGSEDGSVAMLQDYLAKGKVDKLVSEKDNNVQEAMNKGIALAKGEYIHIMNSDNYFTDNEFFEKSLKEIQKYNADFTHADRSIVSRESGQLISIKRGDERTAFFRMPFRYQTMIIKKSVYDEIGPFDKKYYIAGDYKFMLKMILAGKKGCYISEVFICSLDGGITKDRQKCIEEVTKVLFECYGEKYSLTMEDCRNIYLRKISDALFSKITTNIKNGKIIDSLTYCYEQGN